MPPPDPNNTYTKPPSENQILEFINTLSYDEDPKTKMIVVSKNGRYKTSLTMESYSVSHPAKAETQGVTSWISSQHNGV
ncbi:hypothetical protein Tco_1208992, partial [Tanacetum coccineum]